VTTYTRSEDGKTDEILGATLSERCPPPRVVALHCSGSGAHQWKSWRSVAQGRIEIVTPALLGYASTVPWGLEQRVDLSDEVAQLSPVLEEAVDGVHLVGHSYGGAIALHLAMVQPAKVRSLTLYEPVRFSLLREFGDAEWKEIADVALRVTELAQRGLLASSSQHFVDYWSGAGTWARLTPTAREATCLRITKICAEFGGLFSDLTPQDDYRRLVMPVHLLSGTRSPAPALRVIDRLKQLIPAAHHTRLAGLGHMGPISDPVRVIEATRLLGDRSYNRNGEGANC
jgi:pimeloyl-ACP methyl ester carboxylesterase